MSDAEGSIENLEETRKSGTTLRIITGSYEHNLLCVALTRSHGANIFTRIFHFAPHTQSIRCLASSSRYLVSGSNDENIRLYDLQKRKELGTLMHHAGTILCLEFFKNKWLISGGGDGKVCLWRSKDWEIMAELKGHKGPVNDVSVHHTGKIALSVGEDKQVILWNLMTARKASAQKLPYIGRKIQWLPGSNKYVIGSDSKIALYNTSSKPVFEKTLPNQLQDLQVHSDYLVTCHTNGAISFYKIDTLDAESDPEFTLQGHAVRVKSISFLDNYMASVSSDGKIVVWDIEARDQIAVYSTGERLNCVVIVPDSVEEVIKRPSNETYSEAESDGGLTPIQRPKKKRKARVIIEKE